MALADEEGTNAAYGDDGKEARQREKCVPKCLHFSGYGIRKGKSKSSHTCKIMLKGKLSLEYIGSFIKNRNTKGGKECDF